MLTSELIQQLEEQLDQYGDKPVVLDTIGQGMSDCITVVGNRKSIFLYISNYIKDSDGRITKL